ncbi:MAG: 50S ribosomal protein L25 [Deltaproteobacteria bacterium]|nr:50S ribosomal protein L25 [Deltaproteobacteria bacterium]
MAELALNAETRDGSGKGVARKLRALGRIPAVVYGKSNKAESISLDGKELMDMLVRSSAGMNTIFDLKLGKKANSVMLKELQRDPVDGHPLHADLYVIDTTQAISVSVHLELEGDPVGVRVGGGLLEQLVHSLTVECLPDAVPDSLKVDVSEMDIGDMLHVSDIKLAEGVTLSAADDQGIATIHMKREEEEPEVVEEAVEGEEGEEAPAEGEEAAASEE